MRHKIPILRCVINVSEIVSRSHFVKVFTDKWRITMKYLERGKKERWKKRIEKETNKRRKGKEANEYKFEV